jgi:hypothetical protein
MTQPLRANPQSYFFVTVESVFLLAALGFRQPLYFPLIDRGHRHNLTESLASISQENENRWNSIARTRCETRTFQCFVAGFMVIKFAERLKYMRG